MINTNKINLELDGGKKETSRVTTKNIDASIRVEKPEKIIKSQTLSTNITGDDLDVADRLARIKVIEEKKEYIKKKKIKERMAKARAARAKKGEKK